MISFVNKTAIITGASRGIGKAIAIALAKEKVNVVINFCHDKLNAEKTLEEVESYGAKGIIFKADVKDRNVVKKMIDKTLEKFGTIDFLINNAGIIKDSSFKNMSDEIWDEVIETNLTGVFNMTKAVLPHLKNNSSIVNISSVIGHIGNIGQANYAASKSALFAFTKSLAKELGRKKIRVNAIAPGLIETDMTSNIPAQILDKFIENIPLGCAGKPEDIAGAVLFLLQNEYITGEILNVNGGIY